MRSSPRGGRLRIPVCFLHEWRRSLARRPRHFTSSEVRSWMVERSARSDTMSGRTLWPLSNVIHGQIPAYVLIGRVVGFSGRWPRMRVTTDRASNRYYQNLWYSCAIESLTIRDGSRAVESSSGAGYFPFFSRRAVLPLYGQ